MGGSSWFLAFTVYIASTNGQSFVEPVLTPFDTHTECVEASFGEEREKLAKEYPGAAIAAYCVPKTWVQNLDEDLKVLGWH